MNMDQRVTSKEYHEFFADLLGERYEYFDASFSDISNELSSLFDLTVSNLSSESDAMTICQAIGRFDDRLKIQSMALTQAEKALSKSECALFLVSDMTNDTFYSIKRIAYRQAQKNKLFVLYDGGKVISASNVPKGIRLYHARCIDDLYKQLQAALATPLEPRIFYAKVNWATNGWEKLLDGVDWTKEEKRYLHKAFSQTAQKNTGKSQLRTLLQKLFHILACIVLTFATCHFLKGSNSGTHFAPPTGIFKEKDLSRTPNSSVYTSGEPNVKLAKVRDIPMNHSIFPAYQYPLAAANPLSFAKPSHASAGCIALRGAKEIPKQQFPLYLDTLNFMQSIFSPPYRIAAFRNTQPLAFSAISFLSASPTLAISGDKGAILEHKVHTNSSNREYDPSNTVLSCRTPLSKLGSSRHGQRMLPTPRSSSLQLMTISLGNDVVGGNQSRTQSLTGLITRVMRRVIRMIKREMKRLITFVCDALLLRA